MCFPLLLPASCDRQVARPIIACCNAARNRGLRFFVILWLNRSSVKNQRPPPMSGLSLLSYPSSRLFRMCVTSLSYTLGVSTHVLLDTSSSSSFWKELRGAERERERKCMQSIIWFKRRASSFFTQTVARLFKTKSQLKVRSVFIITSFPHTLRLIFPFCLRRFSHIAPSLHTCSAYHVCSEFTFSSSPLHSSPTY